MNVYYVKAELVVREGEGEGWREGQEMRKGMRKGQRKAGATDRLLDGCWSTFGGEFSVHSASSCTKYARHCLMVHTCCKRQMNWPRKVHVFFATGRDETAPPDFNSITKLKHRVRTSDPLRRTSVIVVEEESAATRT